MDEPPGNAFLISAYSVNMPWQAILKRIRQGAARIACQGVYWQARLEHACLCWLGKCNQCSFARRQER
ncbi:conserved hypothetical protein [Ricinus communis]|uniref:Uncharacterized protein n=1 Tax=Ricinus communis TaxID=3988 RepID=B9TAF0_RICCO|nr:conserved hypothetical protein [Ricinus communis]